MTKTRRYKNVSSGLYLTVIKMSREISCKSAISVRKNQQSMEFAEVSCCPADKLMIHPLQ